MSNFGFAKSTREMMIARGAETVILRREGNTDADVLAVQIRTASESDISGDLTASLRRWLLIGEDVPSAFLPIRPNVDVVVIDSVEWVITHVHARPYNLAYEVTLEGVS